jgi:hypothetical protein
VPKTAAGAGFVAAAGPPAVMAVAALHVAALGLGLAIPAGVGAPPTTCATSAFQVERRAPARARSLRGLAVMGVCWLASTAAHACHVEHLLLPLSSPQASMRNPALGLGLAVALFRGTPFLPLVVAPLVISVFVQNTLGSWVAAAAWSGRRAPAKLQKPSSIGNLQRQQTFKKPVPLPADAGAGPSGFSKKDN